MYGFNLGQINGLDSSVKTITATIANATESNTYKLTRNEESGNWTDDIDHGSMWLYYIDDDVFGLEIANFTESDAGDTYNVTLSVNGVEENFKSAVETVLVDNGLINAPETLFDGTITITAEDAQGVEIPFNKDVSSYPFEKWTVTVNGLNLAYTGSGFRVIDDNIGYGVFGIDGIYMLSVVNIQDESFPPVPGDYQVKIVATNESQSDSSNFNIALFDYDVADGTYSCNLSYDQMVNVDGEGFTRPLKPIIGVISSGNNTTSSVSQTVVYDPRHNNLVFYFAAFESGDYGVFKIQLNKNGVITKIAGSTNVTVTWNT